MAKVRRITPSSAQAISTLEAKAQMRVTHSNEDDNILRLIAAAKDCFEGRTGHSVMPATWEMVVDAFEPKLTLRQPPIISIESVKYIDVNGVEQTLSPADYVLDKFENTCGSVLLAPGKSWPQTSGINAVRVRYVAGYENKALVPESIKQWMHMLITDWFVNRQSIVHGMTSKIQVDHYISPFIDWSR